MTASTPPRALIYGRVSNDPTGRGRSVDSQIDECERWATDEGWTVTDIVRDVDRSASRHARRDREGWAEVRRRLEAGEVDVLVTWEASRAQRDLAAYTELRKLCERTGTRWAYSGDVYDMSRRSDRRRSAQDAIDAEDESDRISERTLRGLRSAAMSGRPPGRKLYGYRRIYDPDSGAMIGQEPDPETAAIVAEAADRFLHGEALRTIADDLNLRRVSTPTGKGEWSDRQVRRMLANPAYNGQRVYRGEVVGDAEWAPIHDDDTWQRLTARLADAGRRTTRRTTNAYLLSGVARCGVCGGALGFARAPKSKRRQYACRTGHHVARDAEPLEAFVVAVVLERLGRVELADLESEPPAEVIAARAEVDQLRQRLDAVAERYAAGEVSADMLGRIELQIRADIVEAERVAASATSVPGVVADLTAAERVDAAWDALSTDEQREVLGALLTVRVDRVAVRGRSGFDPGSVTAEWRR